MSDLPRYPRNARPAFHEQESIDRLIAMVVALTSEVSVLRDRVTTLERLGEGAGWLAPGGVDDYAIDTEERAARERQREAYLARVFAVMRADIAPHPDHNPDFWQAIAEIEEKGA